MTRALAVKVLMGDFGTGYSSLNILAQLPLDSLKIDRVFRQGIPESKDNAAIVLMANNLSLDVVFEGVKRLSCCNFCSN